MMAYPYGGFWRRFMAYFLDKVILYIIYVIFLIAGIFVVKFALPTYQHKILLSEFTEKTGSYFIAYYAAASFINMCYFTYFHGTIGQTPGKIILGLRVVQLSGEKMTLGLGFLRWVGYLISTIVFYLGFIWIAFDGKKQSWHDKIAATVVIHEKGKLYIPDKSKPDNQLSLPFN